jgi:hypothetical protein
MEAIMLYEPLHARRGGASMNLELNKKQFRRLLDLVYIGNWILNSTRGDQRFADYDEVESLLFGRAALEGMPQLAELYQGEVIPSRAFVEGGIHEAIVEYENNVFFEILAEDLARRDMDDAPIDESNYAELTSRIDAYIAEFEEHGTDNILVDIED